MVCTVHSFGLLGIDAFQVSVEVDVLEGFPKIDMAGLPDTAVKESRDRINSALCNSGYSFPKKHYVINLAPAALKKTGAVYDLPILIGILRATEQLSAKVDGFAFAGEAALDGTLRGIRGVLSMAMEAKALGCKGFFVPTENAAEAAVVPGIEIYGAANLKQVYQHLSGKAQISPATPAKYTGGDSDSMVDFCDVKGQQFAKKALEIAAAGGHSVLLLGPPGTGKSMLAKRLPTIMPPMTFDEAVEVSKVYSVSGMLSGNGGLMNMRPFRSPHHSVSPAGLTGGGSSPMPGEISLAHNGVLFLDEFPEFGRATLETLRQPMEDGKVTISRAKTRLDYPCRVMIVAAMNPCPCGYLGHPTKPCICNKKSAAMYFSRISGPMLDRLDLQAEVLPVDYDQLSSGNKAESSGEILKRVVAAREIQQRRFKGLGISCNASMTPAMTRQFCELDQQSGTFMRKAFDSLGLSPRGYDRILRTARTIADLEGAANIGVPHISLAVQYRSLDRKYFGRS